MPWLKVDDEFPENDKVWNLSDAAFRLYVSGNCYAVKKLTDGWVPASRVTNLVPRLKKAKDTVSELVSARLWHETSKICVRCVDLRTEKRVMDPLPHGGYMIHDFLGYNPPKWKVRADREAKKRAGQAGGQASAQARAEAPASPSAQADTEADGQPRTPYPVPHSFYIKTGVRRGELRPISGAVSAFVEAVS